MGEAFIREDGKDALGKVATTIESSSSGMSVQTRLLSDRDIMNLRHDLTARFGLTIFLGY